MAKSLCVPTRQQIIDVFNNSMTYEILFTFGVPDHNPSDYCNWEAINFNRMAHARLLYYFLETPTTKRPQDDVLAEDFGYPATPIPLPAGDRDRLNKDLMHLSYGRLRHTPATKPWPDSILSELQDPMVGFMRHVATQSDLFPNEDLALFWNELISALTSGKQLIIRGHVGRDNRTSYAIHTGSPLPHGKATLTRLGVPLG